MEIKQTNKQKRNKKASNENKQTNKQTKRVVKGTVYSFRITYDKSVLSLRKSGEQRYIKSCELFYCYYYYYSTTLHAVPAAA